MLTEQDELAIQRCVDDELSSDEVRHLLQRLDSIQGGWRLLATGFLEDRGLRKTLSGDIQRQVRVFEGASSRLRGDQNNPVEVDAEMGAGGTVLGRALMPSRARSVARHWWSHPVTSLTLCAAIAFVGGMLIPDLRNPSRTESSIASVASNPAPAAQNAEYKFQMDSGSGPVEVPVFEGIGELYQNDRNHPLFSRDRQSRKIRWIAVPVKNGRSMLIPVEESVELQ